MTFRAIFAISALLALPCSVFPPPLYAQDLSAKDQAYIDELRRGMQSYIDVSTFFCMNVYPRPTPSECLDRLKHGAGKSFDRHTAYLSKREIEKFNQESAGSRYGGIGTEIDKMEGTPIVVVNALEGTPARAAGILAGDAIVAISKMPGEVYVSTRGIKNIDEAAAMIRGEVGTTVTLKVRRRGVERELIIPIVRNAINIAQIKGELLRTEGKTYALIENTVFRQKNTEEFKTMFEKLQKEAGGKLDGLIVASPDNPGGILYEVVSGADLFLDAESIVLIRDPSGIAPYTDPRVTHTKGDITHGLPILNVVGPRCASACEILAGTLQFYHRALIASTSEFTYRKGVVQTVSERPDEDGVKYTSSEYLIGNTKNWIPVQCVGVKADVVFSFPGITQRGTQTRECDSSEDVKSIGPMENAPLRKSLKEVNPAHWEAGLAMLEAYKAHMLPKLQKDQARREELIQSQQETKE